MELHHCTQSVKICGVNLASTLSDLLGKSGRRMLDTLIQGINDTAELTALGDRRLHASKEQL